MPSSLALSALLCLNSFPSAGSSAAFLHGGVSIWVCGSQSIDQQEWLNRFVLLVAKSIIVGKQNAAANMKATENSQMGHIRHQLKVTEQISKSRDLFFEHLGFLHP